MRNHQNAKLAIVVAILLGTFLLLQSCVPLRTAVQIGADEGFEVVKATLCTHGHKLYSEVWNDQPPLHTFLVTQVLKQVTPAILGPRLVTTAFTAILLTCVFVVTCRISGLLTGVLTSALLIASPGFLELSSSCMLEIPALSTALVGLTVLLVLPRTKWYAAECLSGVLFGIAALMKLVPLYLLPLAALILWLRWREGRPSLGVSASASSNRLKPEFPKDSPSASWMSSTLWNPLRSLFVPSLLIGVSLIASFALADWLIERGAYLVHFQQSWFSHFGAAKSFEFGSPAEHAFEWSILLKNWDVTAPSVIGICVLSARLRKSRAAVLPLLWLTLSLIVFTNHKPWWSYYYIHIATPLCWCAAVGVESVCAALSKRVVELGRAERKRRKRVRFNGWRTAGAYAPVGLFVLCAVVWMGARVYLQVASIRNSPQLYTALVLKEIERLKPFTHWMYTDQLVYSFHADIPMPPPLAVVPLKRLWTGEMTNTRIAAEMSRFRPEIILLRNDTREVPFQQLLDTEYRMIYQDDRQRLYADRATIKRADSVEAHGIGDPSSVVSR